MRELQKCEKFSYNSLVFSAPGYFLTTPDVSHSKTLKLDLQVPFLVSVHMDCLDEVMSVMLISFFRNEAVWPKGKYLLVIKEKFIFGTFLC